MGDCEEFLSRVHGLRCECGAVIPWRELLDSETAVQDRRDAGELLAPTCITCDCGKWFYLSVRPLTNDEIIERHVKFPNASALGRTPYGLTVKSDEEYPVPMEPDIGTRRSG